MRFGRTETVLAILMGAAILTTAGCLGGSRNFSPGASSGSQPGASPRSDVGPKIGNQAPDFNLKSIDGETIRLADLRGKNVLVNFWATWCPPCKEEMPALEKVYQKYKDQGWVFLGVNMKEDSKTIHDYVDGKFHWTFLMDTEGRAGDAFLITGVPETYIVDRDGIVRDSKIGGMSYAEFDSKLSRIK